MGSGGKTKTQSVASPEQRQILNAFMPLYQRVAGAGSGGMYQIGTQQTPMQIPAYSQGGGGWGPMGVNYGIDWGSPYPGLSMPAQTQMVSSPIYAQSSGKAWEDLGVPMPTDELMSSISPAIKAGVWQPYQEAWNNLYSQALGEGLGISARGGWSGQMGNLFTDFASKAGTQYGQQLWNMVNPNMMAAWQMPYQMAASSLGQTLPTNVVTQNQPGFLENLIMGIAPAAAFGFFGRK